MVRTHRLTAEQKRLLAEDRQCKSEGEGRPHVRERERKRERERERERERDRTREDDAWLRCPLFVAVTLELGDEPRDTTDWLALPCLHLFEHV